MTHDTDIWKTAVEVFHVLLKRTLLANGTRVLRGLAVFGYTAGIHDMTADGIIAGQYTRPVSSRDRPWIPGSCARRESLRH